MNSLCSLLLFTASILAFSNFSTSLRNTIFLASNCLTSSLYFMTFWPRSLIFSLMTFAVVACLAASRLTFQIFFSYSSLFCSMSSRSALIFSLASSMSWSASFPTMPCSTIFAIFASTSFSFFSSISHLTSRAPFSSLSCAMLSFRSSTRLPCSNHKVSMDFSFSINKPSCCFLTTSSCFSFISSTLLTSSSSFSTSASLALTPSCSLTMLTCASITAAFSSVSLATF
mmetsp:Transcript_26244/g.46548  ORF Transcript_26244/g.46548 Transcript_26244/m.46548 type:complete len:228 (-) Transcript_26244:139-822(-)